MFKRIGSAIEWHVLTDVPIRRMKQIVETLERNPIPFRSRKQSCHLGIQKKNRISQQMLGF